MTIQQIRDHLGTVVVAVLVAEKKVRPTLKERIKKTAPTDDKSAKVIVDGYVKDIVDEWLSSTSEEDLERLYRDE